MKILLSFLLTTSIYAACTTGDIPSGDGISPLITEGCDYFNSDNREIILNQKIKVGEEVKSDSLNLKFAAINKAIDALTPIAQRTQVVTAYEFDPTWTRTSNVTFDEYVSNHHPSNYSTIPRTSYGDNNDTLRFYGDSTIDIIDTNNTYPVYKFQRIQYSSACLIIFIDVQYESLMNLKIRNKSGADLSQIECQDMAENVLGTQNVLSAFYY